MTSEEKIFLVDDEKVVRLSLKRELQNKNYAVEDFESAKDALALISEDWPGVLVSDVMMPKMNGLTLMEKVKEVDPEIPVILITGQGNIPMAVQAIQNGAYDFLEKPFATEAFIDAVKRAMEKRRLVMEVRRLQSKILLQSETQNTLIGKAPSIERLRQVIANVADADADILILGETGTGKDLVAQNIHQGSKRRNHNFIAINCGAMPENIIESELFGHEAGAFTGADRKRIGKFEYANKGTVFLDEIESMPLHLQVKLLRVIQEKVVERVGSNETIPLDIRIIAATKTDLKLASEKNLFREDLYYRLNVVQIVLPPLRERAEDIPLLFQHLVTDACSRYHQKTPPVPSAEYIQELQTRRWEGNIRELKNEVDKFVLGLPQTTDSGASNDIQISIQQTLKNPPTGLNNQLAAIERSLIAQELTRNRGDIKKTYTNLGLSRQTLYNRLNALELKRKDFI
ncbi:MAG: sigma-54-dependent Fis family transcriptional regulator [Nitrospinae bacterium]|nr:sigma-54-dependent Fis family transcriptional regulator [Nitrospinota bacterium]MBL7020120.1 sigma-54-dependent Fis family transcriptional regulator [Nitrospinaceae bacterium]